MSVNPINRKPAAGPAGRPARRRGAGQWIVVALAVVAVLAGAACVERHKSALRDEAATSPSGR
jgi:hypothetical protein